MAILQPLSHFGIHKLEYGLLEIDIYFQFPIFYIY